jgi:hypothetical protein
LLDKGIFSEEDKTFVLYISTFLQWFESIEHLFRFLLCHRNMCKNFERMMKKHSISWSNTWLQTNKKMKVFFVISLFFSAIVAFCNSSEIIVNSRDLFYYTYIVILSRTEVVSVYLLCQTIVRVKITRLYYWFLFIIYKMAVNNVLETSIVRIVFYNLRFLTLFIDLIKTHLFSYF